MKDLNKITKEIRRRIVEMHAAANASHIGTSLSCVDILAVLYFKVLDIKPSSAGSANRDRFILSKGHGASALYATLSKRGMISDKYLDSYCQDGGKLFGHCDSHGKLCGVEASTGSLGHGLSIAGGMALAGKYDKKGYKVFVLMGDGECNEGSVWEAAMFASHFKLDNITVIVDRNHLQGTGRTEDIMGIEPLLDKWRAFGFSGRTIDGHNLAQIERACKKVPFSKGNPSIIIAETVKGKGVSFMEDRLEWHYKSPNHEELKTAKAELAE